MIDTVPGTAPLRAAIQVAATVTPALPYLSEPGDVSTHVGRVLLVSGDHPEQLAKMIEVHALGMVETLGNMVAAHPRPNPHDGWLR